MFGSPVQKNDPRRAGRELYAPRLPAVRADLCAVAALERWLDLRWYGRSDLPDVRTARPPDVEPR